MRGIFFRGLTAFVTVATIGSCTFLPRKKSENQHNSNRGTKDLKLVWLSLDGFQPEALEPWVSKLKTPHPKGLTWLLKSTHGRSDLKVINPTITAPSHISTITCAGAGVHGILDNSSWTGRASVSGFNRPYDPENWVTRLRKQGLRVGSSLYPSIDGLSDERKPDIGIAYDNADAKPQLLTFPKGGTVSATIPDRTDPTKNYPIEVSATESGVVTAKTPWGNLGPLNKAEPQDVFFTAKLNGVDRRAAVSFLLVSSGDNLTVEVTPIEMMIAFGDEFSASLDAANIIFSGLRDYRIQANTDAYIATMDHRRKFVVATDLMMLGRGDLDAAFFYFEDLDALLHAYDKDDVNEAAVVGYLSRFDQDIGKFLTAIPSTADLVVLGDHGMSAIGYVLNARKILTSAVADKGIIKTGGGAFYFYPPAGDMTQDPPAGLDLKAIADTLRSMELELTGAKLFGKVIVRGSKEADEEGLTGKNLPWIMAFANDGVAFKDSVEDTMLLARAKWAMVPDALKAKYPDPMQNGKLAVPVPAGQHGHWNEIPQMRTRLVLEGPRLSKVDPQSIEKTLQLVPAVSDALGWQRPSSCSSSAKQ